MIWKVLLCLLLGISAAYADFIPQTDDIPLMDGITLMPQNDMTFDSPAGQILTLTAKTTHTPQQIRAFYQKSLLALGWTQKNPDLYWRGNDRFQIIFLGPKQLRFDITLSNTDPT